MKIYQGATSSIDIFLNKDYKNHLVTNVSEICVYLVQGVSYLQKDLNDLQMDVENNCFILKLEDDETSLFSGSVINIEVRYKLIGDDSVYTTEIVPVRVVPSLIGHRSYEIYEGGTSVIWVK